MKRKTKKRLTAVVLVVMIVAGLSLLLYPTVADYVNSLGYRHTISQYQTQVEALSEDIYSEVLTAAREYNIRLIQDSQLIGSLDGEKKQEYESMLDITGTGIMGYVEIPKVDIYLPIYHGTEETVLRAGIGHLEGSSLPVGGTGVHTILSGHSGLPSTKLFSNIDQLEIGDTFMLHVLRETLTYEVDSMVTVLPEALDSLVIERDKDYCTLITCTPYGINTHRLLVRGHRIATPTDDAANPSQTEKPFGIYGLHWWLVAVPAVAVAVIVAVLLIVRRKRKM